MVMSQPAIAESSPAFRDQPLPADWSLRPIGLYTATIVLTLTLLGLVVAPRRTLRAWRAAGRGTSLFHERESAYEGLLSLRVGALRARLGVPEHGLASEPRALHPHAPHR